MMFLPFTVAATSPPDAAPPERLQAAPNATVKAITTMEVNLADLCTFGFNSFELEKILHSLS
jgi:hypothetical protein